MLFTEDRDALQNLGRAAYGNQTHLQLDDCKSHVGIGAGDYILEYDDVLGGSHCSLVSARAPVVVRR